LCFANSDRRPAPPAAVHRAEVTLSGALVVLLVLALIPSRARAGDRPYAYVYGADSLPPTTVELENWFGDQEASRGVGDWEWWLGPVVGVTDWLEMGMFAIFNERPVTTTSNGPLGLGSLRFVATWIPAEKAAWPVDVRVRLEYGQGIGARASTAWLTVIASRDFGGLNLCLNVGPWLFFGANGVSTYIDYLAGVSYEMFRGIRLGVEFFGDSEIGGETSMFAGPALSFGTGRVWVSASIGPGITSDSPSYHGRVIIGVAL
jgi:hypothetical protein